MGVLHSFSMKNIFYDKVDFRFFLFWCGDMVYCLIWVFDKEVIIWFIFSLH